MNNLRKIVYDILLRVPSLQSNVYFMEAPQDANLPYVVFTFPTQGRSHREQQEMAVQVDIYDCERGGYNVANQIEDLTDNINLELDYTTGRMDNQYGSKAYWFRNTSRISVPYPQESNIWHRELRYTVKTYNV